MTQADEPEPGQEAQRDRLSRLSEASLRINESLDLDTLLQEVLDSARSLTDATYGVITLLDDAGEVRRPPSSGLTPDEAQALWDWPGRWKLFENLGTTRKPLRLRNLHQHTRGLGLPDIPLPASASPALTFLAAPLRHGGEGVGHFFLAEKQGGRHFTQDDEDLLAMFASLAATVITNARRRHAEQRAQKDLETLIDTSPVGIVVFDARTGGPVSFNREAARIVGELSAPGGSPEQLLEVLTIRRADGQEFSLKEFPVAEALRSGELVRAEEIVLQVPDGRSVTTLINATPIYSEDGGELESVVATLQDLTPLGELERLRAEFLGMVGHELRAPLTSIKGSVTTLLQGSSDIDPAEMRQFHRIIDEQADYMRDLISDLLDVARIETGELSVAPEPSDVARLIEEARTRLPSGNRSRTLSLELPADLPFVMADRRRIVQVLTNLLSNASRYSQESSPISVTAALDGIHLAISISDEGTGLSAASLPRLFHRFSRPGDDEGEREGPGSGLGLAICKGIVEAHGGRIWAESDGPGLGARFTFTLPVTDEVAGNWPAGRPRPARAGESLRAQERVLVVDDDPEMLRYVRDALSRVGYAPVVTGDPGDVLRLIGDQRPDLVLLDVMLPGTDGIALMEQILHRADVPVIFLSVYRQDEIISRAFEMGAVDYIVKPFSQTELVARTKAALRRRTGGQHGEPPEPFVLGALTLDYAERTLTIGGRSVPLTAIEYRFLVELSTHAGRVLTYEQLLQRVWRVDRVGDLRPMRTVVRNLRRKLGDDATSPTYIFTEPRVGYSLGRSANRGG